MEQQTEKQKYWQALINQQLASGQARREWCNAHGINYHTFQSWHKRLVVKNDSSDSNEVRFLSVFPEAASTISKASIRISIGAVTLELNQPMSSTDLDALLRVVTRYA